MKTLAMAVLGLLICGSAAASEDPRMVEFYAKDNKVDHATAREHIRLQTLAGTLQDRIENMPWFAGMFIESSPRLSITVQSTNPTIDLKKLLSQSEHALTPYLRLSAVSHSLSSLHDQQRSIARALRDSDVLGDIDIDVERQVVEVRTLDAEKAHNIAEQLGLSQVKVMKANSLSKPLAPIRGGESIQSCTSGFGMVNSQNVRAISTAGHCANAAQYYGGVNLPYIAGSESGSYDAQVHSTPGYTPTNQIWNGSGWWSITGLTAYGSQVIGELVCSMGRVSGYKCGYIRSKTFAPSYINSPTATFITFGSSSVYGQPGDSGGPVWKSSNAYGLISGLQSDTYPEYRIIYMSAEKIYYATNYYILVTP